MLDEGLDNFFTTMLTSEAQGLFIRAISYLEGIEYSTIQDELIDIAFTPISDSEDSVEKPETMVADEMRGHLLRVMFDQLGTSGVVPIEDAGLGQVLELAEAMFMIFGFEDSGAINSTCSMEDSPEGKMAELLQLVTGTNADEWSTLIDTIRPEVIKAIVKEMSERAVLVYHDNELNEKYLPKLRLYSEFCASSFPELKIFNKIGGILLGQQFNSYISSGVVQYLLEGNEMEKLARELYGFALISNDAKNDPATFVRSMSDQLVDDMARLVKLNQYMTDINAKFVKFYQTQTKGTTI